MSQKLKDKVALITGGNAGIGQAVAERFVQEGATVVVTGRSAPDTDKVRALLARLGSRGSYLQTDVSQATQIAAAVQHVVDNYGRLDVAVNNAGVLAAPKPLVDQTEEDFAYVVDINLKGVFLSMKYEIAQMLKTGGGVIINTSSVGGVIGNRNISPYIASKHGVIGLTKAAALEYAQHHIRVNAVAPGGVESDMLKNWMGSPEALQGMASYHPIGRNSQPEEQAPLYAFLASDESSFITGATFLADGGYTAQ